MNILTWLVVGLIAGVLASLVAGGYGLLADIIIGIAGAFIGSWLFVRMGWHTPFVGLPGVVFIAFVGALILLVLLHLIHAVTYRPYA